MNPKYEQALDGKKHIKHVSLLSIGYSGNYYGGFPNQNQKDSQGSSQKSNNTLTITKTPS